MEGEEGEGKRGKLTLLACVCVYVCEGGSYAIVTSSRSSRGHALLISSPLSAVPGDRRCLTWWWSTSSAAVLSVRVLRHDGVLVGVAWNQTSTGSTQSPGAWTQAAVDLVAQGPFQVCILVLKSEQCLNQRWNRVSDTDPGPDPTRDASDP